jgi:DNA-binding NtrC family response regulator
MDSLVSLLIIGKDASIYDLLCGQSPSSDFRLHFCGLGEDYLGFIKNNAIRAVLFDTSDAPSDGRRMLRDLKAFDPLLQIVIAGPPIQPDESLDWINAGSVDYLALPIDSKAVFAVLRRVLNQQELRL